MTQFYDNHANDIEFFKIRPKRNRDNRDLNDMTLDELKEKKLEIDALYNDLIELQNKLPNAKTQERIIKIFSYRAAISIRLKKITQELLTDEQKQEKTNQQREIERQIKINLGLKDTIKNKDDLIRNIQMNNSQLTKAIARVKNLREVDRKSSDKMKLKLKELLSDSEFKNFINSINEGW